MRGQATLACLLLIACGGGTVGDDVAPGDGSNPGGDGPNGNGDGPNPVDVPGGVGEPANLAGITLAHNQARAAVQTATPLPFLTWNQSMADTAAAWGALCTDNDQPIGLIDHNPGRSDGHPYYVGENIYASGGTATGQGAVDLWMSEQGNYNYANNTCNGTCGHYTQVVWRTTLEVGCALATCNNLQFANAIICDYGPGGNDGSRPY